MLNLDKAKQEKAKIIGDISAAIKGGDEKALDSAFEDWTNLVAQTVTAEAMQSADIIDNAILSARGIRQLTNKERAYYTKLIDASKGADPKMAVSGITDAFPLTIIDTVLNDITKTHELLNYIDMRTTSAAIKFVKNKTGQQTGVWGELTAAIEGEINAAIEVVDATLLKLTAFIYVPKDLLDYGPEWVDKLVRDTLSEVIAVSSEIAIVDGDGNKCPIGMTRDISDGVAVTNGAYPRKTEVAITDLSPTTYGELLASLAVDGNDLPRKVDNVILVVNPYDYFSKIMPATTIQALDGTYKGDVLPFPTKIIQSVALESGKAVLGLGKQYTYCIGAGKSGKLEYDDSYKFIEDMRTYISKLTAYGKANDDNAFIYLDISGLEAANLKVSVVNTVATQETASGE